MHDLDIPIPEPQKPSNDVIQMTKQRRTAADAAVRFATPADGPMEESDELHTMKSALAPRSRGSTTLNSQHQAAARGFKSKILKLDTTAAIQMFEGARHKMYPLQSYRIISPGTFTWISQVGLVAMFMLEILNTYIQNGTLLSGSFFSPVPTSTLVTMGASSMNVMRYTNHFVRVCTGPLLHIGVLHVTCNVLLQAMYGMKLEKDWGFFRVLLAFFGSAYVGNMYSGIMNPCGATVGSSGGGFGLIGAYSVWILEHWNEHVNSILLISTEIVQAVVTLLIGLSGQLDNWAHTMGFVTGILVGIATLERFDFLDSLDHELARERRTIIEVIQKMHESEMRRDGSVMSMLWDVTKAFASTKRYLFGRRIRRRPIEMTLSMCALCALIIIFVCGCFAAYFESLYMENPPGALDVVSPECHCCWIVWESDLRFHCFFDGVDLSPWTGTDATFRELCEGSSKGNPADLDNPALLVSYFDEEPEDSGVNTSGYRPPTWATSVASNDTHQAEYNKLAKSLQLVSSHEL